MSFITKSSDSAGYVNVSRWKLGEKQKIGMTDEEIREHQKVWGRHIWISDKTTSLLYKVEPNGPESISLKDITNSWDKPLSKVLRYFIDSTNNNSNQDLEQIRQLNKTKVDKIPELSYNETNKNRIHVWVETYDLLDEIRSKYFSTDPDNHYMTGYFGRNADTVLQVCLQYYLDNPIAAHKQSIKK